MRLPRREASQGKKDQVKVTGNGDPEDSPGTARQDRSRGAGALVSRTVKPDIERLDMTSPRLRALSRDEPFNQWIRPDGTVWAKFFRSEGAYRLSFPSLAEFEISADGRHIDCWADPGTSIATIEHLRLNQVHPLALSLQGHLVFHASAVELQSGAVGFAGRSGHGKSTLAASFASAGHSFLTDDGLLLKRYESSYVAYPSHPSIRLWNDSFEHLVPPDATLAPEVQFSPKARVLSGDALKHCEVPQTMRCFYFLGDGTSKDVHISRLRPSEALLGLIGNSFLMEIQERSAISDHFEALTRLVEIPMFFSLDYPRRYDALPAVREAVIHHAAELYEA